MTGTDLGHIPYNGTSPAVVDIVAGRVSLMFAAAAPSLPLIKDGSLQGARRVSSAERLAEAPEIPPIADAVPGFDVSNWSIILAPAGTPQDIVNRLHAELKAVMATPDVQEQLAKIGMIPIVSPRPKSSRRSSARRSRAGARSCSRPASPDRTRRRRAQRTAQRTAAPDRYSMARRRSRARGYPRWSPTSSAPDARGRN